MENTSTLSSINNNKNNKTHSYSQSNTFYTFSGNNNNNNNTKHKVSQFASMRTFNAVKRSWSKTRTRHNSPSVKNKLQLSSSNSNNNKNTNANKNQNIISKEKNKGYIPIYTHFSDIRKKGKVYPIKTENNLSLNTNLSVNISHDKINIINKHSNNKQNENVNVNDVGVNNKSNNGVITTQQTDIVNYNSNSNGNIKSKIKITKKPPAPKSKTNLILPSLKLQNNTQDNNNNTNNNHNKQQQQQINIKQHQKTFNEQQSNTVAAVSNSIQSQSPLQSKIQNVNNMSIQSVTYTNLNITSQLKEGIGISEQIDTSKCVYCLKRVSYPITLTCKHELCLSCANEIQSLKQFTKYFISPSSSLLPYIKCPKCLIKTPYNDNNINTLLRKTWKAPIKPTTSTENSIPSPRTKIQYCEICPSSKIIRDIAEFECLNCDIVMCYECRIRHLGNTRHIDHKVIQYKKIIQEKIELILCEYKNHKEPYKLYCETCKVPLCVICANYENEHKEHIVKTIRNILDEQITQLSLAIRDKESEIKIINELLLKMNYSHENIEKEKNVFIEQITSTFNEIYNIIKSQEDSIKNKIDILFNSKLNILNTRITNLTYIKNRYDHYKNLICDRDIDIIERVNMLKLLNKRITKISELNILHSELMNQSLHNSILINNPLTLIKNALYQYKFLPITDITVSIINKLFALSSIIKPEMILSDFIVILPKIKSGNLIYKISNDGASTYTFHEKCDNKGPTLTIVKTDTGHIFGGFNPVSYISESIYSECDDSFIFSLSNGHVVKPIKCPVKLHMKQYAIKQNEVMYSPGFGEIDFADLFISFKNLSKSYSNLGRVYKLPKNENGKTFLAGKESDWKIEDVEVYAIEVISEEEYMKMILN